MLDPSLLTNDIESELLISIAIPTFNQSIFLDLFFKEHIVLLKKFNIPITISDNASSDSTEMIVRKWQKEFHLISYYCNSENIGYDKNVLSVLGHSKTKYTWLMGDTYFISIELLKKVLLEIKKFENLDFLVINLEDMVINTPSKVYTDQNRVLSDLGGVMTCLSCLIFNRKIIDSNIDDLNNLSAFIHLEMILNYISNKRFTAVWIADYSVKSLKHSTIKKINWSHKSGVLEIGFKKWVDFVFLLPATYSLKDKHSCIRSFGKLSKLGTFRGFILMRMRGHLTFASYKKYKTEIELMRSIPTLMIRLIILVPPFFLKSTCKIITKFFNLKSEVCS